jgi:metallo-beta-lactamase family protein
MKISFHGADRDVTGSCHLIECAGQRILIDCGMFQGSRELEEENAGPLGFDAASVDVMLLTHAHLDHCGRLPLLVKRGFRGRVLCTAATAELANIVMQDAAHMAEDDADWEARHHPGKRRLPLYTRADAVAAAARFTRPCRYGERVGLDGGLAVSFHEAGHILGSASVLLEFSEHGRARSVLFSGDIGSSGRPILREPAPPRADIVIMETTYGDRGHRTPADSIAELIEVVRAAQARGGNVVIPSFALERSQEILYVLREAVAGGQLPSNLKVYMDSPMALSAIEVYRRHCECYDEAAAALIARGGDLFGFAGLHLVREASESKALNRLPGGAVIIAGSGMCTGGRIRHHLVTNLPRSDSSIVFVGYASQGTPARRIIDGAATVRLFGEEVPVRASVHTIGGFSAHADQAELLRWHGRAGGGERTILVHGEAGAMAAFGKLLAGVPVLMPAPGSEVTL